LKAESPFDCLKPEAIAALAEDITYAKATKPAYKVIPLAITAGAFIAIAFVFFITVTTGAGNVAWGLSKLVGGLCFALGLILCVLLGAELFTSTTLTLVAKAANRITWAQLFKNWGLVYFGNLIGGLIIVGLIIMSSQYMDSRWSVGPDGSECGSAQDPSHLLRGRCPRYPLQPHGVSRRVDGLRRPQRDRQGDGHAAPRRHVRGLRF